MEDVIDEFGEDELELRVDLYPEMAAERGGVYAPVADVRERGTNRRLSGWRARWR